MDGIEDVDDNRDQWTIALKLNCIDGDCTHKLHAICLSVCLSQRLLLFLRLVFII